MIDRPIWIKCKRAAPLALRLVAIKKPEQAAAAGATQGASRDAQREGHQLSKQTLDAAHWVILVTSLSPEEFTTDDVLALYRLRWRIELGFKRLKSLIGLKGPPGTDERSARPHVLAHLLMILLLEPLVDQLEELCPACGRGRLTRSGAWRLLQQLIASLLQASHSTAHNRPAAPSAGAGVAATSPRAAQTQAPLSSYDPTNSAPMRESGDFSIPETPAIEPRSRGALGPPRSSL